MLKSEANEALSLLSDKWLVIADDNGNVDE
jgi:hypothetical protein